MDSNGSFQELVPLGKSKNHKSFKQLIPSLSNNRPISKRAPSYSDSFIFQHSSSKQSLASYAPPALSPILSPKTVASRSPGSHSPVMRPIAILSTEERPWVPEKIISFLFHIGLISMFETIFFFYFVSSSENSGILKIISLYVNEAGQGCQKWNTTQTQIVNDILRIFVNVSEVYQYADQDMSMRNGVNHNLYIQSWIYVCGLVGCLLCISVIFWKKGWIARNDGKRIVVENLGLVCILGLYEFLFFRTIVYQYDSISVGEIDEYVVQTLNGMCGLFSRV